MDSYLDILQFLTPWSIWRHNIIYPKPKNLSCANKKILITGATAGLGKAAVEILAEEKNLTEITLASRNHVKAKKVIENLKQIHPQGQFNFEKLDLSDFQECEKVAKNYVKNLNDSGQSGPDIIIGNSGVWMDKLVKNSSGHEMTFATNHLGHFVFIITLLNQLIKFNMKLPERIVMVTSAAHLFVNRDLLENIEQNNWDFNFEKMKKYPFNDFQSYSLSKLFNIYFVRLLNQKLGQKSTKVYAIHPGACKSEIVASRTGFHKVIVDFVMAFIARSSRAGAASIVQCACSDDENVKENSGKYFENCVESESNASDLSKDLEWAQKIWNKSVEITGTDLEL